MVILFMIINYNYLNIFMIIWLILIHYFFLTYKK